MAKQVRQMHNLTVTIAMLVVVENLIIKTIQLHCQNPDREKAKEAKAAGGGKTALEKLERRRHQLRKTGVELVFGSGEAAESVFLAFPSNAQR